MDFVGESFDSTDGDDDKVYLFFSENAMEYDYYSKVAVSRVARVCKVKFKNWVSVTLSLCKTFGTFRDIKEWSVFGERERVGLIRLTVWHCSACCG